MKLTLSTQKYVMYGLMKLMIIKFILNIITFQITLENYFG